MNALRYNDIVMCNIVWNPGACPWQRCVVKVPLRNPWERNNPLVLHGRGFWQTAEHIVIGYVLRKQPCVFRPIFQVQRNRRLQKLHRTLTTHQGPFVRRLRHNLARHAMLGVHLPVDIIIFIVTFL